MLKGYKTYITGIVAIISALGAYLVGEAGLAATLQLIFTALLTMFIRAGVSKVR